MTSWTSRAACLGQNPDRWFPTRDDTDNHGRQAKQICAGCPVRLECLVDALKRNEDSGIWGGAGEVIRRDLSRVITKAAHDPAVLPQVCGCLWCISARLHFASIDATFLNFGVRPKVVNRNGANARCGLRATYTKGCRCSPCSWSTTANGLLLAEAAISTADWWDAHDGPGTEAEVSVALRDGWKPSEPLPDLAAAEWTPVVGEELAVVLNLVWEDTAA